MPNNKEQALKKAIWLKGKFASNDRYFAEENLVTEPGKVWYLPHHGVYHPHKPNKIRVVFNCSAKYNGTSLNSQLLQGPDLTNSLIGVLQRFRREPIAIMGDIEAMFHQVRVPPQQCDFLRFLWWPDGNLEAEIQEYQMLVHLFGATSSPSCSNYALKKSANDAEPLYGNLAAETVRRNVYVDDCLTSVKEEETAVKLIDDLPKTCAYGGFRLTKFVCNHRNVLQSIPIQECASKFVSLDLGQDSLPIERALGVQWCVESDTFGFKIMLSDKPTTRRGILSTVSSVYDPLGFVAPIILPAKKVLQDLCKEADLGWDDEIPSEHQVQWTKWRKQLPLLDQVTVNRCYKPPGFGVIVSKQIHTFSDASTMGYGSVAYLRLKDNKNQIHCTFLFGKAHLAPIKVTTVPRL
ncbi:uncharacterized protein LOC116292114 [Actinia tenebrosa]|uniref:Uncharacterized protein LOC116292114 n=1 Tax=Actinia tenebrosa TaxID=6105 RepID=A0A6P8HFN7_ACTTE|nr:uncharacterized protein LOC116292114 [Actinia tenebrosa]